MTVTDLVEHARLDNERDVTVATPRALPIVAVWFGIVATGGVLVYLVLVAPGSKRLDGVPLHAAFDPHLTGAVAVPAAVACAVIAMRRAALTLEWWAMLVGTWLTSVVWALALAVVRGPARITAPFRQGEDYLAVLGRVDSLGAFLSTFVEQIRTFPIHVQGHPPGFVVLVRSARSFGLGGPVPVALACVALGAAAAPLALVVVREVAGESWARRAAPFTVLAPTAIWVATSADALFGGAGAAAVALVVLGTRRDGRRADVRAFGGGFVFGLVALLSYGLVLLAAIPLVVAGARRNLRALLLACAGAILVVAAVALAGFWWLDGLLATRDRYFAGIASRRPYELFVFVNLAILALALGPAVAVGLARVRDRRLWLVLGGALLAVALADLSGMSKSEVERIWLPFTPFMLVAAGALVAVPDRARPATALRQHAGRTLDPVAGWLAAQAAVAIAIEVVVRTAW